MPDFLDQLDAERTKLLAERSRIDGILAGLDKARQLFLSSSGLTDAPLERERRMRPASQSKRPSPIRDAVFEALSRHPDGLSYADAAREAGSLIGQELKPKTVSSLLSVQAREGAVIYQDGRYKLPSSANGHAALAEPEGGAGAGDHAPPAPDLLATVGGEDHGPA